MKCLSLFTIMAIQIVIKLSIASNDDPQIRVEELWNKSTDSQLRLVAQLSSTFSMVHNISRFEFLKAEPKLNTYLQNNFPACDKRIFVAFMTDLEVMISSTEPILCDTEMNSISLAADKIFIQGIHLQSWFQQLITCIETKGCDFEKKYRQTHNKLARLIDEINDVERNVKRLKWSLTHKCYSYLVKQIDNKIYRSSLTQDECLRIKNYKTFLHKLSLLPLTMDSFLETNHQDKPNTDTSTQWNEEKILSIWDRYEKISIETFDCQTFLFAGIQNIAQKIHNNLQPRLTKLVQDKISTCHHDLTKQFMSDLDHIFLESQPSPCHVYIEHFQEIIENIFKEGIGSIEPKLTTMSYCTPLKKICDFNAEYNKTVQGIEILEERVSRLKSKVTSYGWNDVTNCYNKLASRIENKISPLSPTFETCETITDYDELLKELKLFPLDLDTFSSEMDATPKVNYTCSDPVGNVTTKNSSQIKIRENRMIRDQLSNLTMGIRSYLDNLQMKMSPVFNSSLSHILTTLHGVMDQEMMESSEVHRKCYEKTAEELEQDLVNWYMTTIYSICWDPIPKVMRNFSLINQHVLPNIGGKVLNDPDCSTSPPNVCSEAVLKINKLFNILNDWKEFDLSNTIEFAKKCYRMVNSVLLVNIREHHDQLNKCQLIPYNEHVFQNLPVNVETYPPSALE